MRINPELQPPPQHFSLLQPQKKGRCGSLLFLLCTYSYKAIALVCNVVLALRSPFNDHFISLSSCTFSLE